MSSSTDPLSAASEPPWPPDLCFASRVSSFPPASNLASAMFLHPELISAAQSILRKRIAAAEAELPPFATAKDRRRIRYQQRQAMVKLCNNLDASSSHSPKKSSPVSDIPNVVQRESSPNGKSSPLLEA
ncbi:unnamed protein product [Brassica rapa subsp. narinosa]